MYRQDLEITLLLLLDQFCNQIDILDAHDPKSEHIAKRKKSKRKAENISQNRTISIIPQRLHHHRPHRHPFPLRPLLRLPRHQNPHQLHC